jgi:hypothetical protein
VLKPAILRVAGGLVTRYGVEDTPYDHHDVSVTGVTDCPVH